MCELSIQRVLASFSNFLFNPRCEITKNSRIPVLDKNDINNIILGAKSRFVAQPLLLRIPDNTYVVGDLHGNIFDLLRIFQVIKIINSPNILFLGDYVDRGEYSIEVMVLLFALTVKFPRNIFLIRGNHEFEEINAAYGFKDQVMTDYNSLDLWNRFNDAFSYMPLAAVIGDHTFCVHGGLSEFLHTFDDLDEIKRPVFDTNNVIVCDITWSDPTTQPVMFAPSSRNLGSYFGEIALKKFLQDNKLSRLIRAHQYVNGVEKMFDSKCITVFSSSDYRKDMHNKCGFIKVFKSQSSSSTDVLPMFLEPLSLITPKEMVVEYVPKPINPSEVRHRTFSTTGEKKSVVLPVKRRRSSNQLSSPKPPLPTLWRSSALLIGLPDLCVEKKGTQHTYDNS